MGRIALDATQRAQGRARKARLRTLRVPQDEPEVDVYRVRCTSGKCGVLHRGVRWHHVGVYATHETCDCVHGRNGYRGVCQHIGAVLRRRDFRRPPAQTQELPPRAAEIEGWWDA